MSTLGCEPCTLRTVIVPPAVIRAVVQPAPAIVAKLSVGQGPAGPAGVPGLPAAGEQAISFSYGDATPALIGTIPAGYHASWVRLDIYASFDGAGAQITVGTLASPTLLMDAAQSDLTQVAAYESWPLGLMAVATAIYLFITPGSGASAGNGHVLIKAQL